MGCITDLILLPIKILIIPFRILENILEAPGKSIDRSLGRTRCPRCRSSDLIKTGRKWHCNHCGRNFRWNTPSKRKQTITQQRKYPSRLKSEIKIKTPADTSHAPRPATHNPPRRSEGRKDGKGKNIKGTTRAISFNSLNNCFPQNGNSDCNSVYKKNKRRQN